MNPPLPPLPLTNGALFIDNSFIEKLDCPRQAQYTFLNRRVTASERVQLNFGTAGHLIWAFRYRKYGTRVPDQWLEQRQVKILEWFFNRHPLPDDPKTEHLNLNWAVELMVKRYNKRYEVEPFNLLMDRRGRPLVEMCFALKLFTHHFIGADEFPDELPIYYCGRIDLPIVRDSCIFIKDHKTTGEITDRFWNKMRVNPQFYGYCWAFPQLIETKMPVAGFYVNAVRTAKQPAKPRNGVDAWWEEALQRNCEYVRKDQIEEWRENTINIISDFLHQYSRGYLQMKKTQCVNFGKCQYYDICNGPKEQREFSLEAPTFMDNEWSPLRRV